MLCALCDQDDHIMQAIAVCRRCGAGACRAHATLFCYPGAPGGMLGMSPPRREYVCQLCVQDTVRKPAGQRVIGASDAALPDAESLIRAAEALLVGQRQPLVARIGQHWRKWWQARLLRVLPGLARQKVRQPRSLDDPAGRHVG